MIRTQPWRRGRMGDAVFDAMVAQQAAATLSPTLRVCDARGNCILVAGSNYWAASTAVNNGTPIAAVMQQYGGSPADSVGGTPSTIATPAPVAIPIVSTPIVPNTQTNAPALLPNLCNPATGDCPPGSTWPTLVSNDTTPLQAAASSSGFSFSSIPTWGYIAAGIGLFFLFSGGKGK